MPAINKVLREVVKVIDPVVVIRDQNRALTDLDLKKIVFLITSTNFGFQCEHCLFLGGVFVFRLAGIYTCNMPYKKLPLP